MNKDKIIEYTHPMKKHIAVQHITCVCNA